MPEDDPQFRQVFERYQPSVYAFFKRKGLTQEECLDLTQETFFRVYKSIQGFRGDASLDTWIRRVATNLWCNEIRRRKTEKRDASEVSLEAELEKGHPLPAETGARGALEGLLDDEQRRKLRRAMDGLPEKMRRCLVLRIDQGLKYREIAVLMQVSIDTVKAHIFQARTRLARELGDLDPSDPEDGG
jgi:RNA polymerase sigma-70 factor (ECF subfamily)